MTENAIHFRVVSGLSTRLIFEELGYLMFCSQNGKLKGL